MVTTTGASGARVAVIAVPVYSLKDNSTVVGVLGGGINLGILNKELQSLNLTSVDDNTRVVYVDNNRLEAASDKNKSTTPESFANLNSFRNAIKIVGGGGCCRTGFTIPNYGIKQV